MLSWCKHLIEAGGPETSQDEKLYQESSKLKMYFV